MQKIKSNVLKILLIEDNQDDIEMLQEYLHASDRVWFELSHTDKLQSALVAIQKNVYDTILVDLNLPDSNRLTTFLEIQKHAPETPILVLTGTNDNDLALDAVQKGAQDYLLKGQFNGDSLIRAIQYAIERKQVSEELRYHRDHLKELVEQKTDELRKAMETLAQTERIASLKTLVTGVAHEINTPLSVGLSMTYTINQRIEEFYKQSLGDHTSVDAYSVRRILDKVSSMCNLAISNLEKAGQLVDQFKQVSVDHISGSRRNFDLVGLIKSTFYGLNMEMEKAHLTLKLDLPSQIMMDSFPGPIGQIITNFVMNSIHHGYDAEEHGEITVKVHHTSDDVITLIYLDNGKGISKQNIKHIFDPFFTTRSHPDGHGLGLNVVHSIVTELLQGSVDCLSTEGNGVCFTVQIPKRTPHVMPKDQIPQTDS